jgi:hypothetical protein
MLNAATDRLLHWSTTTGVYNQIQNSKPLDFNTVFPAIHPHPQPSQHSSSSSKEHTHITHSHTSDLHACACAFYPPFPNLSHSQVKASWPWQYEAISVSLCIPHNFSRSCLPGWKWPLLLFWLEFEKRDLWMRQNLTTPPGLKETYVKAACCVPVLWVIKHPHLIIIHGNW